MFFTTRRAERLSEPDEVRAVLEGDSGLARKPYGREDLDLFTLASRPISLRERLALARIFLTKRVPS
jgi:hypothetical protein